MEHVKEIASLAAAAISSFTLIIIAGLNFRFNRQLEHQRKEHNAVLAELNSELTKSVQQQLDIDRAQRTEALEQLKRDLQDTLAQRARRADYLRAQINNLYGPLAFLAELSARCLNGSGSDPERWTKSRESGG